MSISTKRLFPEPLGPTMAMCSSAGKDAEAGAANRTSGLRATPPIKHIVYGCIISDVFCLVMPQRYQVFLLNAQNESSLINSSFFKQLI